MTFYPFYLYYLVDSHFQCRINSHNKVDAILHTNMHSGYVLWVHMVMVMYSEWFYYCHLLLPPNNLGGAWMRNTSLLFKPQVFGEFFYYCIVLEIILMVTTILPMKSWRAWVERIWEILGRQLLWKLSFYLSRETIWRLHVYMPLFQLLTLNFTWWLTIHP